MAPELVPTMGTRRLSKIPSLLQPRHLGKKSFLTVNCIGRKRCYFENAHEGKKTMQGTHHPRNLITRPKKICSPPNGILVVKLQISDVVVGKVLMDNGSTNNFLFMGVATMMGVLDKVNFRRSTIQVLSGIPHNIVGTIRLKVQAKSSKYMIVFCVIGSPSPYNIILDREWLHIY